MARSMASPTAAKPTQCPSCGARITRPELSLCAYCATPLAIGGPARTADEATLKRLGRMGEHKDYAEALSWQPNARDDAPGTMRRRRRGLVLATLGIVVVATVVAARASSGELAGLLRSVPAWVGVAVTAVGLLELSRAAALVQRVRAQPLLKRPAIVMDRRSVTTPTPTGSQTVYFFSLVFDDGSAGEFSFLGRGVHYEVPASGATGLACTRGARLLEFLRLRV
jgi:hypothetical protein